MVTQGEALVGRSSYLGWVYVRWIDPLGPGVKGGGLRKWDDVHRRETISLANQHI